MTKDNPTGNPPREGETLSALLKEALGSTCIHHKTVAGCDACRPATLPGGAR